MRLQKKLFLSWLTFYVVLLAAGSLLSLQAQELKVMDIRADPAFEVATIKLSDPGDTGSGFQLRGERVHLENESVESMLIFAFGVQSRQLVNLPAWTSTAHYDVSGLPDKEGQPSVDQMRSMVRKLLVDRFKLRYHQDMREMPVYVLELAKGGPHLSQSKSTDGQPDQTGNHGTTTYYRFTNNSSQDLAGFLKFELDRPVLDETKLPGRYDFELRWAPDLADKAASDLAPPLPAALQQQLGLRLDPQRRPAPVLVLDHLETPSAN